MGDGEVMRTRVGRIDQSGSFEELDKRLRFKFPTQLHALISTSRDRDMVHYFRTNNWVINNHVIVKIKIQSQFF
jgi:hypothetical protein